MIAERAGLLKPATIADLAELAEEMERTGEKIIWLDVGEPDFNTPHNVCESAKRAIDAGHTKYTAVKGIFELRQKICEKLLNENGIAYTPDEIDVTVGAKQAVFNSIQAICNAGDEIIVPIPSWFSYDDMVRLSGGTPVLVPVCPDNFVLDLEKIKESITGKTKAIIINTPNNPTGAVYSEDVLRELAEIVMENDLYVISDEVYETLLYEGQKHFSIASISPEMRARTFTVNGFSKTYAMTGWRVGYVAAPSEYISLMAKIQNRITSGNSSISQYAAIEALSGSQECIKSMREEFSKRREYMYERLCSIKGIKCAKAEGAFYFMPDMRHFLGKWYKDIEINTTVDLTRYLLLEAKVAVVDGESFNYPGYLRFSYSNSMENIVTAMDQIEKALDKLE